MDISGLTIDAARSAVAERKTSALALAESFYAKIEADDREDRRVSDCFRKSARSTKAAAIDASRCKAASALPPLAGVPVGIKDVMVTKGVRTTAGSKILGNYIPPYDAQRSPGWRRQERSCWARPIAMSSRWARRMRIRRLSRCTIRAISAACPEDHRADRRRRLRRTWRSRRWVPIPAARFASPHLFAAWSG